MAPVSFVFSNLHTYLNLDFLLTWSSVLPPRPNTLLVLAWWREVTCATQYLQHWQRGKACGMVWPRAFKINSLVRHNKSLRTCGTCFRQQNEQQKRIEGTCVRSIDPQRTPVNACQKPQDLHKVSNLKQNNTCIHLPQSVKRSGTCLRELSVRGIVDR